MWRFIEDTVLTSYVNRTGMISVIMPAYNVENYIARGIGSILQQTYANWELVIIDDGSTDATHAIASEYAAQDSRIRLIRQENGGVSAARNHGIELAQGEYAVFLDADDWLRRDALSLMSSLQETYPEQLIACNAIHIKECDCQDAFDKENDRSVEDQSADEEHVQEIVLTRRQSLLNSGVMPYNTSGCFKLFRNDILIGREIRFDPDIRYAEDGLFVFRYLLAVNGMLQCNDSIGRVLERSGSATRVLFSRYHLSALQSLELMRQAAEQAHDVGELGNDDYTAVDASLQSYGGEQAYNNCRRYLDSGIANPEIDKTFKNYLHRYSAAYCHAHSRCERMKYQMMTWMPWPIYIYIYIG